MVRYKVKSMCHQGYVRQNMEDSAYPPCGFDGVIETPCAIAVADGVGGLPGGEVASGIAIRYVEHIISEKTFKEEVQKAHLDIQSTFPGSATTLTVALLEDGAITVYWIGDSYALAIYESGDYRLLTRPHVQPGTGYITRVLGMGVPQFDKVSIDAGGLYALLLFTDGLTAHFSIPQIVQMFIDGKDLIEETLLEGAIDNIALVIAWPTK